MSELKSYIKEDEFISIRSQCELLDINRSSYYYSSVGESTKNLQIMRLMDAHHLSHPTHGVLQMQDFLWTENLLVNEKRVRRLLRLMGLIAIYPKRNLSKLGHAKYVRPYLLRGMEINRPNQVWATDITYIPMAKGFMYLTAIIDVYSRYIVGWELSNNLYAEGVLDVLKKAIKRHGQPEIINSDQGAQFTCPIWTEFLDKSGIQISMDGKGRATDNIYIERFWRTLKQDYVYLNPALDGIELFNGIKEFIDYYNNKKSHQGIERKIPVDLFKNAA